MPQVKSTISNLTPEQISDWIKTFQMNHRDVVIMQPIYHTEKELEGDWSKIKALPTDYRVMADSQAMKLYGKKNEDVYRELRSWFLTHDTVEQTDTGEKVLTYTPSSYSSIEFKEAMESESYIDSADDRARQIMASQGIFLVINSVKDLKELEKMYELFVDQSDDNKLYADQVSMDLYGISNDEHYIMLKHDILEKYPEQEDENYLDDVEVYFYDPDGTVSDEDDQPFSFKEASYKDNDKFAGIGPKIEMGNTLHYYENTRVFIRDSDNILESVVIASEALRKEPESYVESEVHSILKDTLKDRLVESFDVNINMGAYFTPDEMQKLGVYSNEDNHFYSLSDNKTIGIDPKSDDTPYNWYLSYVARCLGLRGPIKNTYTKWVTTVHNLTSSLPDSYSYCNESVIAPWRKQERKQAILELGWNPEIPFTEENIKMANERVNRSFQESIGYDFINLANCFKGCSVTKADIKDNMGKIFIHFFSMEDGTPLPDDYPRVAVSTLPNLKHIWTVGNGVFSMPINYDPYISISADGDGKNIVHVTTYCFKEPNGFSIENTLDRLGKQTYEYSFINYICRQFHVTHMEVADQKLYCIYLINMLLELTRDGLNSTVPVSFPSLANLRGDSVNKDHIYKVYDGKLGLFYIPIEPLNQQLAESVLPEFLPYIQITPFQD